MKKLLALIITLATVLSLAACGSTVSTPNTPNTPNDFTPEQTTPSLPQDTEVQTAAPSQETDAPSGSDGMTINNVSYVMIYNPYIYDENNAATAEKLSTGSIGSMVDVDAFKASGLETPSEYAQFDQFGAIKKLPPDILDLSGNRGGNLTHNYKKGDKNMFYGCMESNSDINVEHNMTCMYAGKYCNVWSDDPAVTNTVAEKYGKIFDDKIFNAVTTSFGLPRSYTEGHKIDILFHKMPTYPATLCGYAWFYELAQTGELPDNYIKQYGINIDHSILHMNSNIIYNELIVSSTMAHEYQHLVCFSAAFETVNGALCRTWLNESMSAYIEEKLFPGTKESGGTTTSFLSSDLIRGGQSMYNFTTSGADIGVYGSVYYFADYLTALDNDKVFNSIHNYWRESYSSTLCEAEAIARSVSPDVYKVIDESLIFPSTYKFNSKDEEWMSKLILNFYIGTLQSESINIPSFKNISPSALLYDEINPAEIEGGGRIIIAVKDGKFTVPDNADKGLLYVAFDKDFKILGVYN